MDPAQPARPGRPYLGFALLYAAYCISYVDRAAIALALTQIGREFGLSPTEYGVVLSVFFFGYSLMQLPGGWLADRFGSKYVVIGTAVAWSIFTALTGLAWSFTSLIVIRLIFGLAEGGFPAACIKAVSEQFTGPARPKMSSLMISSNYVGSLLAPLVMAPLLIYFGWRHAFFIVGAAGLVKYRSTIDDPKEAVVMLCALGSGLAAGVGLYILAPFATVFMAFVLWMVEYFEPAARKVFDGVLAHISGIGGIFLNHEFAQPTRTSTQHEDHTFPENEFPFSAAHMLDPITGKSGSLLRNDGFDPLWMETNTSTEYWQKGASLLATDPLGQRDIELPPNARVYQIAGTQHNGTAGMRSTPGPCANSRNPHSPNPALRALLVALDEWHGEGKPAPASNIPRIRDGMLIAVETLDFPAIPGVVAVKFRLPDRS